MTVTDSNRLFLSLKAGTIVNYDAQTYEITHILDVENILARNCKTREIRRIRIVEIAPPGNTISNNEGIQAPATSLPDEDWNEALKRFEIIQPLLAIGPTRTRLQVAQRAKEYNKGTSTLYHWISCYESTGLVSSLVRQSRSDKGESRLSEPVEEIIKNCIQKLYLNKQRYSINTVYCEVKVQCKNAGLSVPHPNTIRNRIATIASELKLARRRGKKEAQQIYHVNRGSFPGADFPLAVVQIDHTLLDIILVDDIYRRPIGRAWITVAFDVFSRIVCGFYISLDPPGAIGTGLCLAHAILPKENWLAKRELSGTWPIWGVPDNLHLDNAKEFRGNDLRRACQEYGITINFRPVKRPHYGGHIERMMGNFATALRELPGATFSNPKERGEYDSEAKAVMTLKELEKWIGIYIVEVYHQSLHSELGTTPLKKFEEGIFGSTNKPGRGLPPRATDETRIILDFLPYEERTVQNYGVVIDDIFYYSHVLRKWVNANDPNNPKLKCKFIFKRDLRDISKIYFLDPELNIYYPIPYRDTTHPAISIWELREAKRYIQEKMDSEVNEDALFKAYEKLRTLESQSSKQTKKVRRDEQRRRLRTQNTDYKPNFEPISKDEQPSAELNINIQPFTDIDEDIKI